VWQECRSTGNKFISLAQLINDTWNSPRSPPLNSHGSCRPLVLLRSAHTLLAPTRTQTTTTTTRNTYSRVYTVQFTKPNIYKSLFKHRKYNLVFYINTSSSTQKPSLCIDSLCLGSSVTSFVTNNLFWSCNVTLTHSSFQTIPNNCVDKIFGEVFFWAGYWIVFSGYICSWELTFLDRISNMDETTICLSIFFYTIFIFYILEGRDSRETETPPAYISRFFNRWRRSW